MKKTENCTAQSRGWKGRCPLSVLASIMTIALLNMSCTAKRVTTNSVSLDSLKISELLQPAPIVIPPSKAILSIPLETLRNLSEKGDTAKSQSGQASVSATIDGDQLNITGTCDELIVENAVLKREIAYYKKQAEMYEKKVDPPPWFNFKSFILGGACVLVTLFIKRLFNKQKKHGIT